VSSHLEALSSKMPDATFAWTVFSAFILALVFIAWGIQRYYADPTESYPLASTSVIVSLTVSMLVALIVPVDIYVISRGNINAEFASVVVSQGLVQRIYLCTFAFLLFLAYVAIPFAYFYGEERGQHFDLNEDKEPLGKVCGALRYTAVFILFVTVMLLTGLVFRPGHNSTLQSGKEMEWVKDLLDVDHAGDSAILFAIGGLTCVGILFWIVYTAYGMAAFPFALLKGRRSAAQQRYAIELDIAALREKHRQLQQKYGRQGALDPSKMSAKDRRTLQQITRDQKLLTKHNYKLQELESAAGNWLSHAMVLLAPFRWTIGSGCLVLSLMVFVSLSATTADRFFNSSCGAACGYVLSSGRSLWNPVDDVFTNLARYFPMDFALLAVLVVFILAASIFGVTQLGIRFLFIRLFPIKPKRSTPQAMLLMSFTIVHTLLVLCMTLLTVAPNYASFGYQFSPVTGAGAAEGAGGGEARAQAQQTCTLEREGSKASCHVSVLASFFSRISAGTPLFSSVYFFAHCGFLLVYFLVFVHAAFIKEPAGFDLATLDEKQEAEEEEVLGLLSSKA